MCTDYSQLRHFKKRKYLQQPLSLHINSVWSWKHSRLPAWWDWAIPVWCRGHKKNLIIIYCLVPVPIRKLLSDPQCVERDTGIQYDLWRSPLLVSSGIQGWTGARNLLHLGEMFVASESRDQGLTCGRMPWGCGGEVDVIVTSDTEGKEEVNPKRIYFLIKQQQINSECLNFRVSSSRRLWKNEGLVVVPAGSEFFLVGLLFRGFPQSTVIPCWMTVYNTCPSVHPSYLIQV